MSTQPTQPEVIEVILQQTNSLSFEDKKALAEKLLAGVSEEEQRAQQRIKNQAALDFIKKLAEENADYEEENWAAIQEAIDATIRK